MLARVDAAPETADISSPDFRVPRDESLQKQVWYAVYTRTRHEKSVAEHCNQRGVTSFLPLYCVKHRWSQRFASVLLPLFPSYVFVQIAPQDRVRVLSIPGIVCIVSFHGFPAVVPDSQIEYLSRAMTLGKAQPHTYLRSGKRVRVTAGPLVGLEGIVTEVKNHVQVVVSFEWMNRSVAISLDPAEMQTLC